MAVDDIARMSPTAAMIAAVPATWSPPRPKSRGAHLPEHTGLQLESDEKEHHHHSELREVHHVVRTIADQAQAVRSDEYAGEQVAEDRAETKPARNRDGDDRGDEIDKGIEEEGIRGWESGAVGWKRGRGSIAGRVSDPRGQPRNKLARLARKPLRPAARGTSIAASRSQPARISGRDRRARSRRTGSAACGRGCASRRPDARGGRCGCPWPHKNIRNRRW